MKDRLKQIRKSLGLTQQELSDSLGVSKSNIVAYELGNRTPSSAFLQLICARYNANMEWITDGTGEMFNPPEDQDAAYLEELLSPEDNPLYDIIKATMKTYMKLDSKDQDIIKDFAKSLIKETKET